MSFRVARHVTHDDDTSQDSVEAILAHLSKLRSLGLGVPSSVIVPPGTYERLEQTLATRLPTRVVATTTISTNATGAYPMSGASGGSAGMLFHGINIKIEVSK